MASSGNFCILNRLPYSTNFRSNLGKGNLYSNPGNNCMGFGTMALTTGKKWYMEGIAQNAYNTTMGIFELNDANTIQNSLNTFYYNNTSYKSAFYHRDGTKYIDGSNSSYGAAFTTNDKIGMAVDLESGTNTITFYKNNASQGSFNLGTNGLDYLFCMARGTSGGGWYMNFGQDSTFGGTVSAGGNADANGFGDFFYAVPAGHLAVCSANLGISSDIDPAQTDNDIPTKQFGVLTYTTTGGNSYTGLGFQPDLVWGKCRTNDQGHWLFDSSRGATNILQSNEDTAEYTSSGLTSFDTDGFTMGSSFNQSGRDYVAWCWRCNGGTTSSNTQGDITTTVQANQAAGFSIFTYTGNAAGAGTTLGHGLSKAPDIWLSKQRSDNGEASQKRWRMCLNTGTGGAFRALHNSSQTLTLANSNAASALYRNEGNFEPTSTVVQMPNNGNATAFFNLSGSTYVSYCWHSVEGYSKFGTFEGNSNADGPFIYTGFRPRLVFCKSADASENWQVRDTARSPFNADSQVRIYWNSSAVEGSASTASPIDFLSNGFKVRGSNSEINSNTIVFGAWGDVPYKYNNTF
jgi:hypothetical protein